MRTSEKTTEIFKALHGLQQDLEIIKRDDEVEVKTAKGSYKYKFTGLPKIWLEVKPLLKKHGLTVIQTPTSSDGTSMGDFLQTTIVHTTGEFIQDTMRLVITRDDPQGFGSAITFARRYALSAMLGVITDDDNDATTQRLADGEMKKEWVQAYNVVALKNNTDHVPTANEFMSFMTEVYGKHPSKVLAKEHENVLGIIKAFDSK